MEIYSLKDDINVFCVPATKFPEGIAAAWEKLHSLVPPAAGRIYYGISYADQQGNIIYKAAVNEAHQGEAEKFGLETFIIKNGKYLCEVIPDWEKDVTMIGRVFQKLIADPRIDKNGACIEVYSSGKEVRCMVRLAG